MVCGCLLCDFILIIGCFNVLNLVMMYIDFVPFYSLRVDIRLKTCAKLGHFCPQLSKLSIISQISVP